MARVVIETCASACLLLCSCNSRENITAPLLVGLQEEWSHIKVAVRLFNMLLQQQAGPRPSKKALVSELKRQADEYNAAGKVNEGGRVVFQVDYTKYGLGFGRGADEWNAVGQLRRTGRLCSSPITQCTTWVSFGLITYVTASACS